MPHRERRRGGAHWAAWAVAVGAFYSALALAFAGGYFPLDETVVGGPGDYEPYAAMNWIVAKTLAERGELPLWNPYVYTGLPLIGDAYISFFNPAVVLPLLAFGPTNGGKVAAVVALALSGVGQYWLSRVLGQARVVALTAGVLGLTAGGLVARLGSGFNFGQAMQHAWVAATLAAFLVAVRRPGPGAVAVAAACYALLYHAGNLYYWLVVSLLLVIVGLGYAWEWRPPTRSRNETGGGWRGGVPLRPRWGALGAAAGVAAVGALLMAAHALPLAELRLRVDKPIDTALRHTVPPLITLLGFAVRDAEFWDGERFGGSDQGWAVHHAYLGAGLFVFPLGLVLLRAGRGRLGRAGLLAGSGRDLVLLAACLTLTVLWASGGHTFFADLWRHVDALRQLRFWGSASAVAGVVIIPLALAGADAAWRTLQPAPPRQMPDAGGGAAVSGRRAARATWLPAALAGLLVASLLAVAADSWRTNGRAWAVMPYDAEADALLAWLRRHDGGAYLIRNGMDVDGRVVLSYASTAHIRHEMQILNSVWLFRMRLAPDADAPDGGRLVPAAKYAIVSPSGVAPADGDLLRAMPGGAVYRLPAGLPFAFVAEGDRLPYGPAAGSAAVTSGSVVEARARFDGPNRLVVEVPAEAPGAAAPGAGGGQMLVVMQGAAPGWRATREDGASRAVGSAGGFLAVAGVRPGERYVLSFRPPVFLAGAGLSLAGLVLVGVLLGLEVSRRGRASARSDERWRPGLVLSSDRAGRFGL